MHTLLPAPSALFEGGEPRYGSFRGALPRLDLQAAPVTPYFRFTHEKRWAYVALADARVFVGAAIVGLGYASTAIVFVLDRERGVFLVDRSLLLPGRGASFADHGAIGRSARFVSPGVRLELGDRELCIDLGGPGGLPVHVSARIALLDAPAIGAFVPVQGGYANATEKRVARASGEVVAGGRRFVLDDALAAFDHTHGLLARHTAWRWALGLGRAHDGRTLAFNLVEGFVGEAECALWLGDELVPLGEGRFSYDAANPSAPWAIRTTCGALDLRFEAAAVHQEHKNLGLVRSAFVQPVGHFTGTLRHDGDVVAINVPGVTEHQDVRW